ncbi:MAG: hypothetical protein ABRQ24_08590 [Syntrophomonadaceae bacterium]
MRAVLRKLYRHQMLNDEEFGDLREYADRLRAASPPSYELFYERYASILHRDYHNHLPRSNYGVDDLYDFLLAHPDRADRLRTQPLELEMFPVYLRDHLSSAEGLDVLYNTVLPALAYIESAQGETRELPRPRLSDLVVKYESGNPLKETGLKAHFDRLGAYSFISRLQSVRYLRGAKASQDRIEVISDDCLGGIFTNKAKSIYYFIYLTENDRGKASHACRVLNRDLYGLIGED